MESIESTNLDLGGQSSFEIKFQECRLRRKLGHFSEAVASLEKLRNTDANLSADNEAQVVGQIAWTQLLQGFFKESHETLDRWILAGGFDAPEHPVSSEIRAFLELLTEFLRVNCHGDPKKSVEIARVVFERELKNVELSDYSYTLVCKPRPYTHMFYVLMCFQVQVEAFYQRIILFAVEMRILERGQTQARVKTRLQPLFDMLCASQRWEELITIADILVLSLNWPEDAQMFTRLLQVQDLPQLDKARAHLEAGKLFHSHKLYTVADEHLKTAREYFNDLGHVYGELDIKVARCGDWGNGTLSGREQPTADEDWVTILCDLYSRYEEVAFPIGMLKALLKLGELARLTDNFVLAYTASKICSEIAHETGSRFFWIQFQIAMLAAALPQLGREPVVIASGTQLMEEIKIFQTPYFEGVVASILSLACSQLADNSQSEYWAGKAAEAMKESPINERSLLEYQSAVAKFSQTPPEGQENQHLQELSSYLNESIERDMASEFWKYCADKLVLLSQAEFSRYRNISVLEAVTVQKTCLQRALEISQKLEESDRLEIFASVQSIQAEGLMLQAGEETGTEKETLVIERLYSVLDVCGSISPVQRAHIYCQLGPPHWSIFTKTSRHSAAELALAAFRSAYEIFESLGITESCIVAMHGIAWSLWLVHIFDGFPPELDLELLSYFLKMEKWTDLRRDELSTLQTLDSIRRKQQLSSRKNMRDMYSMSLEACVRLKRFDEAWYWVQKSKARSVSDLLGLGIKIPESLMADLRDNPTAVSLLEEETTMQKTISELPREKRVVFQNEMNMLRQRMAEHDALCKIMGLRKGDAATLSNLKWVFDDKDLPTHNRSIIFVDWGSEPSYKRLSMFVVDESRHPIHFQLDLSITDVENWCEAYWLDPDDREETLNEEDDEDSPFRELDGLVNKLQFCSKPGDLLVLSPTSLLHSIPLHTLRLPKTPNSRQGPVLLIERNPVIYCPSITILKQCVFRAQSRLSPSQVIPPAIFAVYESQPEEEDYFNTAERTAIYQHAGRLGEHLHTTPICGNQVTKKAFSERSTKAPLIHFHGHCRFDSADVLAQALILGDESTTASPNEPSSRDQPSSIGRLCPESPTEFSVEDIFDLNLSSPHITLIACDSASQKFSAGDEPLGILTAFLCAGATSVVGTMWPTATREGRAFSEIFYRCLGSRESAVTGIFDYAGALRETVLTIRGVRDSRLPYFWAPFVLHGSWFGKSVNLG